MVEFDDVINKQRETIYEERDKVLHNEDLTDTIQAFVDQEIDIVVDRHLSPDMPMDSWDMAGLVAAMTNMGLSGPEITEDELWDLHGRDAVALRLKDLAAEKLEQKDEENSDEWALIERLVLLRTIDSIWVEHLTEIDEMRQGIGLRGLAQEEPLNAFKREAYALYEEMSALIRHQVASTIFRVSIVRTPAQPEGGNGTGGSSTGGATSGPNDGATDEAATAARIAAGAAAISGGNGRPLVGGRPLRQGVATRSCRRRCDRRIEQRYELGRDPPRLLAGGRSHGPQRRMLVRLRQEIQEVPRTVGAAAGADR